METFDYSTQGRRPSVAQIVAAWKRAGKPAHFSVTYGETYAEFELGCRQFIPQWFASGNGQRGVERDKVAKALQAAL
jgi:hypothetical protein